MVCRATMLSSFSSYLEPPISSGGRSTQGYIVYKRDIAATSTTFALRLNRGIFLRWMSGFDEDQKPKELLEMQMHPTARR